MFDGFYVKSLNSAYDYEIVCSHKTFRFTVCLFDCTVLVASQLYSALSFFDTFTKCSSLSIIVSVSLIIKVWTGTWLIGIFDLNQTRVGTGCPTALHLKLTFNELVLLTVPSRNVRKSGPSRSKLI